MGGNQSKDNVYRVNDSISSLHICVEKSLSTTDRDTIVENFGPSCADGICGSIIPGIDVTSFAPYYNHELDEVRGDTEYGPTTGTKKISPYYDHELDELRNNNTPLEEQYISERYPITSNTNGTENLLQRLQRYVDDGIIQITDPELSLRDAILQRKFTVKKVTVSFVGDPNLSNIQWTPLIQMRGSRDQYGNPIQIDPIESTIRDMDMRQAIEYVVKERLEPVINLPFEFIYESGITNDIDTSGVVRISFNSSGGTWAIIGLDHFFSTDTSTMNFAWLDAATIMHEFGHMLGLIHEHQLERGNMIEWDRERVYDWASTTYGWSKETTNRNILDKYDQDQLNGTAFDPTSIMLYFFPASLTLNNKGTDQNLRLALNDLRVISTFYPGKDTDIKEFYKKIYSTGHGTMFWIFITITCVLILLIIVWLIWKYYRYQHSYRRLYTQTRFDTGRPMTSFRGTVYDTMQGTSKVGSINRPMNRPIRSFMS